jgi:alpha-tubulin suppressor-like RCC1 family protein
VPFLIIGDNWVNVSCGKEHTLAINIKGELYGWGNAANGRLGPGRTGIIAKPVQIGTATNWTDISCGEKHSAATRAGSLYTWGSNASGELGDGTNTEKSALTQIVLPNSSGVGAVKSIRCGKNFTAAVTGNGSLYLWGNNASGQLGDSTGQNKSLPTKIITPTNWLNVSCGMEHTAATRLGPSTARRCYAWGSNFYGELGSGTPSTTGASHKNTPTLVSPNNLTLVSTLTRVSCGGGVSCGLTSDGNVIAWGAYPIQGRGTVGSTPQSVIGGGLKSIVVRGSSVFGIDSGNNVFGASGYFESNATSVSAGGGNFAITTIDGRILTSGMAPDLELKQDWRSVSVSRETPGDGSNYEPNVAAINVKGQLYIQGYANSYGQLGHNNPSVNGNPPVGQVPGGPWVSVELGATHAVALDVHGNVYTWGDNSRGQLGCGSKYPQKSVVPIKVGGGQVRVSCGQEFTVALNTQGLISTWGYDNCGQIGDGVWKLGVTPRIIYSPTTLPGTNVWTDVAAGDWHVVALMS